MMDFDFHLAWNWVGFFGGFQAVSHSSIAAPNPYNTHQRATPGNVTG